MNFLHSFTYAYTLPSLADKSIEQQFKLFITLNIISLDWHMDSFNTLNAFTYSGIVLACKRKDNN